ncbi:MAG: rhomboid family intramembrane serine protease [Vicinamibacteria bacterium]
MRPPRSLNDNIALFGARFPVAVVLVSGLTLFASLVGAVGWRNGFPLLAQVGLVPDLIWSGQVWRLVTWSFFNLEALPLIFAVLMVLFFGRDLCHSWGGRRFLLFYLGISAATALAVCLVGRLGWGGVWRGSYYTCWPIVDAITIVWATMYPSRQILLYFVLPVGGQTLIYLTVFGTLIFAFLNGFDLFVPHFVAMGLGWLYLRGLSFQYLWLRFKLATGLAGRWRPSHLRPVEKKRDAEPPRWLH